MGNIIFPMLGGTIVADKGKEYGNTISDNLDSRHRIHISYERLYDLQEIAFCQILSKMRENAGIKKTYVKTICRIDPDTNERHLQSFQMPSRVIHTQDKNGVKVFIEPDGENGYFIKASVAFWKNACDADDKYKASDSQKSVENFMDDILKALKAKTDDNKTPTIENAEKISFFSRWWRNCLKAFVLILLCAILIIAVWAFITFLWPVIAVAFGGAAAVAIIAPSLSTVGFAALGIVGGAAAASLPIGTVMTVCSDS